jgi:hypothetical protein
MLAQQWNHNWKGMVFGGNKALGDHCFICVVVRTANGQKKSWRSVSISIMWAMLQIMQFAHSATPF